MVIDQKSFCAAPWFQIRNDQDVGYRPCCELRPEFSEFVGARNFEWPDTTPIQWLNSAYVNHLKKNIIQGRRLPECQRCWDKEAAGATSLRQTLNDTLTNNRGHDLAQTWMGSFFHRPQEQQKHLVLSCDIKINNLCNYACLMCDPENSTKILTKWRQDRHVPIIQERIRETPAVLEKSVKLANDTSGYELLKQSIDLSPQHLKILGGEPLIDPKLLAILEQTDIVKKRRIKLLFVTNGSVDLHSIKQRLTGWKDVSFVVSLEGIRDVQDYVRQGSCWDQVEQNIRNYLAYRDNKLYVHFCLQSLTLAHMPDLLKFAQELSISVSTAAVDRPEYLSLRAIPDSIRPGIQARLQESKAKLGDEHCRLVDAVLSLLEQQVWEPRLTQKKSRYIDWYDPDQRWRSIFPEWEPYLR